MSEPRHWITVAEAAVLAGRHPSQIYRWIDNGRLATRTNVEGITQVLSKAIIRVESEMKRGRPKGAPSRR